MFITRSCSVGPSGGYEPAGVGSWCRSAAGPAAAVFILGGLASSAGALMNPLRGLKPEGELGR